ncbi:MAG: hypothetical protein KDA57_04730 [Planctomycetales bacterium]|nr:hypothetical protein [Planctomycetales bacterium]
MAAENEYDEFLVELRESVCSRCVERQPGGPPCAPLGRVCGIEQHFPQLVELCQSTESVQMEPYAQKLHDQICADCDNLDGPTCPCPLRYLLQLAVEAVERVQRRRNAQTVG